MGKKSVGALTTIPPSEALEFAHKGGLYFLRSTQLLIPVQDREAKQDILDKCIAAFTACGIEACLEPVSADGVF